MLYPNFSWLKKLHLMLEPCSTPVLRNALPPPDALTTTKEALKVSHAVASFSYGNTELGFEIAKKVITFGAVHYGPTPFGTESFFRSILNSCLKVAVTKKCLSYIQPPILDKGVELLLRLEQARTRMPEVRNIPLADLKQLVLSYVKFMNGYKEAINLKYKKTLAEIDKKKDNIQTKLKIKNKENQKEDVSQEETKQLQAKLDKLHAKRTMLEAAHVHFAESICKANYGFSDNEYLQAAIIFYNQTEQQKELQILKLFGANSKKQVEQQKGQEQEQEQEKEIEFLVLEDRAEPILFREIKNPAVEDRVAEQLMENAEPVSKPRG